MQVTTAKPHTKKGFSSNLSILLGYIGHNPGNSLICDSSDAQKQMLPNYRNIPEKLFLVKYQESQSNPFVQAEELKTFRKTFSMQSFQNWFLNADNTLCDYLK